MKKSIIIDQSVQVSGKRLDFIYYLCDFIMSDLYLDTLTVNISSYKDMNQYDANGLCLGYDEIEIINKRDKNELISVIAHEIRHCYQHKHNIFNKDTLKMERDACEYEKRIKKMIDK